MSMKILFMGTPDFALFSLRALVEAGENVIGVITQPDKPKGRGYTLTPPPVKVYATEQRIPVYQPNTLRGEEFANLLAELAPDLIIVVAYGKILPANVLEFPKYGCINVHGSILPAYRGAAPMQRAIMEGQVETGITTMMMDVGLDTGDMLLVGKVTIEENDCLIDFSKTANEVHNQIRGLSPIPLAFTYTPDGKMLKVTATEVAKREGTLAPAGTVLSLSGGKIEVACGCGSIFILSVLPEGKKRMAAADFINGRKIAVGDVLSAQ